MNREDEITSIYNKYHDLCIKHAYMNILVKHKQEVINALNIELELKEKQIPITIWEHIKHYFSIKFESRNPNR